MTTIALPNRIKYGGTTPPTGSHDLASYANVVTQLGGWDELPVLRGVNSARTGVPGTQFLPKLFDARRPSANLFLLPTTDSGGTHGSGDLVGAMANLDTLKAILGVRGYLQVLSRLMPDATTRWGMAEVWSLENVVAHVGGRVKSMLATWEMPDPLWYGAASTGPGSTATTSSPTDFTFTIGGSYPTQRIVVDFTGPITHPRITNLTTGEFIDADVVVATAEHLVLDVYNWTATDNGASIGDALSHAGLGARWLTLLPGGNSLRVTSSSPGGSVLVTAYPAFL